MPRTLTIIAALTLAAVLVSPRPVAAQDGCGLLGALFGCDYNQREQEIDNQHAQNMAQINAQATAVAQQLEYQRWLDSQRVQTELQQIAARERVDMAKIQAELERMYSDERTSQLAATTAFNVAALQSDAMIAAAAARAEAAQAEQVTALLLALVVLSVAGAMAFMAWQYTRLAGAYAQPLTLPADDWQRRAVAALDQKGVPWAISQNRLIAQIDGEWVRVEGD